MRIPPSFRIFMLVGAGTRGSTCGAGGGMMRQVFLADGSSGFLLFQKPYFPGFRVGRGDSNPHLPSHERRSIVELLPVRDTCATWRLCRPPSASDGPIRLPRVSCEPRARDEVTGERGHLRKDLTRSRTLRVDLRAS